MKLALPLLALCLTGCVTKPIPVHPDVRITQENARLIEQRDGLIEHMDMLQKELFRLRLREEYLTHELLMENARRLF